MRKGRYKVEVWSKKTIKGIRYYHHLICVVPHTNILSTGVHKSRSGRSRAVKSLKSLYANLQVFQVSKPTKSK